ncbi:MAG: T9SS type A sorting domain-containing protein [Balneolales bacterium]
MNSHVRLEVYNMLGSKIATLVDGNKSAGSHHITFDGSDLASGMYIYRIQANEFIQSKKFTLIK